MGDWIERLAEIPSTWHSQRIAVPLLQACGRPGEDGGRPPEGTQMRQVRLKCRRALTKAMGERAYKIEADPAWFVRVGWTPIPYFDKTAYMRAPDDLGDSAILVPAPTQDVLLDVACRVAAEGAAWRGTAWLWPATFTPARVGRPGWSETSSLATFTVGHVDVWSASVTWDPTPVVHSHGAGEPWATTPARVEPETVQLSREELALTSLERLGVDRFLTFLRVVAPGAHCGAVRFFLEELETGKTPEQVFVTGDDFGYSLHASAVADGEFIIAFGCSVDPLCGDGGQWQMRFDENGDAAVVSAVFWVS